MQAESTSPVPAMLDAEAEGRSIVDQAEADQPSCPWEEHFGAAQSPPENQPETAAKSRTLQAQGTEAIDPGSQHDPSTPMNIDISMGPSSHAESTSPVILGPPGMLNGPGDEGISKLEQDKALLSQLSCINLHEMINAILRPEFADDHDGQYGAKQWICSRNGTGIMGGDSRPTSNSQRRQAASPYQFPSLIPRNYRAKTAGWLISEAPKTHDMCISWDSTKELNQWEISRMKQRRADEESANWSIMMALGEGHGGAIAGSGIPDLGSVITEEDAKNRTWCKHCEHEANSGRCYSGIEYTPLPARSYKSIWYHHHNGVADDAAVVPVCIKCQRNLLLEQLDHLMTNPVMRAVADAINAQTAMTKATITAMNSGISSSSAAVIAAPITMMNTVASSHDADE